jgi:hypothetical protein
LAEHAQSLLGHVQASLVHIDVDEGVRSVQLVKHPNGDPSHAGASKPPSIGGVLLLLHCKRKAATTTTERMDGTYHDPLTSYQSDITLVAERELIDDAHS